MGLGSYYHLQREPDKPDYTVLRRFLVELGSHEQQHAQDAADLANYDCGFPFL